MEKRGVASEVNSIGLKKSISSLLLCFKVIDRAKDFDLMYLFGLNAHRVITSVRFAELTVSVMHHSNSILTKDMVIILIALPAAFKTIQQFLYIISLIL